MAECLVAVGSNTGDRASIIAEALRRMAALPTTCLIARSRWHETPPIGGPSGQGAFLNAAVHMQTEMPPLQLLDALQGIEQSLGRAPAERWAARAIDLDLLLYDTLALETPRLTLPHPRMAFRRFALEPAAEAAPWMVHGESGWTVAALLGHLNRAEEQIAVAAATDLAADALIAAVAEHFELSSDRPPAKADRPTISRWLKTGNSTAVGSRPKLLLAIRSSAGSEPSERRTMLGLPARGPVAWIGSDPVGLLNEALAAVEAVWPALGATCTRLGS